MFYSKIVELSWLNNTGGIKITLNYVWISVKTVIFSNIRNQIWGAGGGQQQQAGWSGPGPAAAPARGLLQNVSFIDWSL